MLGMMPMAMSQMPTIGNPQAQEQQQEQALAQVLQMYQRAQSQMQRGQSMQGGEYIQNSGLAGVLAKVFSSYKGAELEREAGEDAATYAARRMKLEREEAARQAQVDYEREVRLHGDKARITAENRAPARSQPVWTNQGLMSYNPETGTHSRSRPAMQGHDGMQVQIDPSLPPEVQASILANEGAWASKDAISGPSQSAGPLMPYRAPEKPEKPTVGAVEKRKQEVAALRASGIDLSPQEERAYLMTGKPPAKGSGGGSLSDDEKKVTFATQAMKQDAINFAAAFLEKSPDEVAKMTPEQVRDAIKKNGRFSSGPVIGSLPGMRGTVNADLEAYSNSAAGKKARMNNPTGPVSNADFEIARRSIFSSDKPDDVNADLIYQALGAQAPAPAGGGGRYQVGQVIEKGGKKYRVVGGDMNDPDVEEVN